MAKRLSTSPRPWELTDAGPDSGNCVRGEVYAADGAHIADLLDTFENKPLTPSQWLANARLIRAAPELLAACRYVAELSGAALTKEQAEMLRKRCQAAVDFATLADARRPL